MLATPESKKKVTNIYNKKIIIKIKKSPQNQVWPLGMGFFNWAKAETFGRVLSRLNKANEKA